MSITDSPQSANRESVKTMVRGIYDLQQLRIQMGNRLCAQFRAKLGQLPGTPAEETVGEEGLEIIKVLKENYKKITDGVIEEAQKKRRSIKDRPLPKPEKFHGTEVISTFAELVLIDQYIKMEGDEERQFKLLEPILRDFRVYTEFLEPISGVGPAMAGVIISEIDIAKADTPASLWKYCGYDVVVREVNREEQLAAQTVLVQRLEKKLAVAQEESAAVIPGVDHKKVIKELQSDLKRAQGELEKIRTAMNLGPNLVVVGEGRSRRREHLVKREYTTREGETELRDSITFNPFIKTKLRVLAGCLLKSRGGNKYQTIYRKYREKLDGDPRHNDKTKMHKMNMAIRYMLKAFLVDLYNAWRAIEGLEVKPDYPTYVTMQIENLHQTLEQVRQAIERAVMIKTAWAAPTFQTGYLRDSGGRIAHVRLDVAFNQLDAVQPSVQVVMEEVVRLLQGEFSPKNDYPILVGSPQGGGVITLRTDLISYDSQRDFGTITSNRDFSTIREDYHFERTKFEDEPAGTGTADTAGDDLRPADTADGQAGEAGSEPQP